MCCGQTGACGRRAPESFSSASIEDFVDLPRCVPPCDPALKLFGIDSGENTYEYEQQVEARDCDRQLA